MSGEAPGPTTGGLPPLDPLPAWATVARTRVAGAAGSWQAKTAKPAGAAKAPETETETPGGRGPTPPPGSAGDGVSPRATWLDRPADPAQLQELFWDGEITAAERDEAIALMRPPRWWRQRLDWLLLGLGAIQLVAGIVFFFAYNWQAIPFWAKSLGLQLGLVACFTASLWQGWKSLGGQVLLSGGAVLVGVHLAVFGQEYQTGADPWQLFAFWALLITPWVFLGRFGPLTALWLGLLNLALHLGLRWRWMGASDPLVPHAIAIGGFNIGITLLTEGALRHGQTWLDVRWLRQAVLGLGIGSLSLPAIWIWHGFMRRPGPAQGELLFGALLFFATAGTGVWYYRNQARDLASLTLITLAMAGVAFSAVVITRSGAGWLFIDAALAMAIFGGAAVWLTAEAKRGGTGHHG